jgi:hypothetical protein
MKRVLHTFRLRYHLRMNKFTIPVFFLGWTFFSIMVNFGCEGFADRHSACDPCIKDEPDEGEFKIEFSQGEEYPAIPFRVFKGTYESGALVVSDTATETEMVYTLETETDYTVVAEYKRNGKTILVIDEDRIKTRSVNCADEDDPESTVSCWYVVPARVYATLQVK